VISLPEVQREILGSIVELDPIRVPSAQSAGLVLAEDIAATDAVPPFANSAMDGYAVRASDTARAGPPTPVRLAVIGELPAGRAPTVAVGVGEAIRIMTGAPMPEGADAIVMVERTRRDDAGGGDGVFVEHAASVGDHVRRAGGDIEAGDLVFARGSELGPAHVGVLASIGCQDLPVIPRARVGVLSTGDELVDTARELAPGEIRDSNRPMLLALVAESGCDALDLGHVRDDEAVLEATLREAASSCDAIVTSGGVSVGDYDVVKAVLGRIASMRWWQVAIRPAKPLAFGLLDRVPVFGLPGNPVSSLVSFELFARPALRAMTGHRLRFRSEVMGIAEHDFVRAPDGKLHLDRVRIEYADGSFRVSSVGAQASNALAATAHANGLARLPDGPGVHAGDPVAVLRLDGPCDH
jgi:molybdenum cofactor synthesis domain-containing protein